MLKETTDFRSPLSIPFAEFLCARPAGHLASSLFKVRQRDRVDQGCWERKGRVTLGEPPGLPSSQRRRQLQPIPNLPALPDRLGLSGAEAGGWLLWCGAWDPRQALSGHSQGAKLGEGGRLVGLGWRKESGGPRQKPGRACGRRRCSPSRGGDGGGVLGWEQCRKFSLAPSVLLRQEYFLQRPLCPLGASWQAGNPGCFLPISGPYW